MKFTNLDGEAIRVGIYVEPDPMFGEPDEAYVEVYNNTFEGTFVAKLAADGRLEILKLRADSPEVRDMKNLGFQFEHDTLVERVWSDEADEVVDTEVEYAWIRTTWEGFDNEEG